VSDLAFVALARRIGERLRRRGLEGEDAFYAVARAYADLLREPAPATIAGRGARSLAACDADLTRELATIARDDPGGAHLPGLYLHFVGRRFRHGSGKFFTPRPVAAAMAALLPRRRGALVMDPTCGGGTFLVEAARAFGRVPCRLIGNDQDPVLVDLARLVLGLAAPERQRTFVVSDVFEPGDELAGLFGRVDAILANPPFSLALERVARPGELFRIGYRTSDSVFLDVCLELLRPGGRLVCLLPHSIVANDEFRALRAEVERSWSVRAVIGLPEGVFHLTADTTTRADVVVLEKGARPARRVLAFAPTVGVPLNRRRRAAGNGLAAIVSDPCVVEALEA
jgi:type I restriction-modification system DNA methylase subunit